LVSEENISQWTASTTPSEKTSGWLHWFTSQSPLASLVNGQRLSSLTTSLLAFLAIFLFGVYCVKRCLLNRAATASLVRRTQKQARQARREAMHLSYESSDGYSGSEMEFDN